MSVLLIASDLGVEGGEGYREGLERANGVLQVHRELVLAHASELQYKCNTSTIQYVIHVRRPHRAHQCTCRTTHIMVKLKYCSMIYYIIHNIR